MEWYRNFLAVYRAGSVSGAARTRHLTQPAVSQQLAALEGAVGAALFVRTSRGMQPTERGRALYGEVFDALDRLERVSRGLRGRSDAPMSRVRLGAAPDYVHAFALQRLREARATPELVVQFGDDRDLLSMLEAGELDVAVTSTKPGARSLEHRVLAEKHFALVGPPNLQPPAPSADTAALAGWLSEQPWVGYSHELPATRRFFQQALGVRFSARQVLVVPDLRAVLRAVELGYGVSLMPDLLCREALAAGRVKELWPVRGLLPGEQWVLSFREVDGDRFELLGIMNALGAGV